MSAPARRPAFRCAHLEFKVAGVAVVGLQAARRGDRIRAIRAVFALDDAARLPSPGLSLAARRAADAIRAALGHRPMVAGFPRQAAPVCAVPRAAVAQTFGEGALRHAL